MCSHAQRKPQLQRQAESATCMVANLLQMERPWIYSAGMVSLKGSKSICDVRDAQLSTASAASAVECEFPDVIINPG
jgi:hypothetical protein